MCMYKLAELPANKLTPAEIYLKLSGRKKFLLESTFGHEKKGTYSFIGMNPYQEIIGTGSRTIVMDRCTNTKLTVQEPPLEFIKNHFPAADISLPFPFYGGGIGYIGYDAIRQYENIGEPLPDDLEMPDVHFMLYENTIIVDHRKNKIYIVAVNVHGKPEKELDRELLYLQKAIEKPIALPSDKQADFRFQAETAKEDFMEKVQQIQRLIQNGEARQVVLSQRFIAEVNGRPFSYYQQLRKKNPSPYMFYIDFDDYILLGSSPESLIRVEGKRVTTNPIAGTRPRGKTIQEDEQLTRELLQNPKELAEHRMLVDLSKEDLRKVCERESISVPTNMAIEKYEHVMHIVSEVQGILRPDCSGFDALLSCFPAGTVSGSPRHKAMTIINQYEEKKRGVYAGGIGYINYQHDMNFAIAIRSLVIKQNKAYLQAGAGIVLESDPEREYFETLNKAKSLTEKVTGLSLTTQN